MEVSHSLAGPEQDLQVLTKFEAFEDVVVRARELEGLLRTSSHRQEMVRERFV